MSYPKLPPVVASGTTAPRYLGDRFADIVTVKDFGAKGDGVTDDAEAIQTALDLGVAVYFPEGVYRTTQELVLRDGSKIIGSGHFSAQATLNLVQGQTVIMYDGEESDSIAIVRASKAEVGIDPNTLSVAERNLQNAAVKHVTLDGKNKIGYGLYISRAGTNNVFDFITVRGTTKHGFWIGLCWQLNPRYWTAWKNKGCGVTIGIDSFGWGSATVDQAHFDTVMAMFNGYDSDSSSFINVFSENDATTHKKEYGVGICSGRASLYTNIAVAVNGGAGIYCEPTAFTPTTVDTFYCENNGLSSGSTRAYPILYNGGSSSYPGMKFSNGRISSSSTSYPKTACVRLTGSKPSRPDCAVVLENIPLLEQILSDWDRYVLINCDSNVSFGAGTKPSGFSMSINGDYQDVVVGSIRFVYDVSQSSITTLSKSGAVASITRVSTGVYDITLDSRANPNRSPMLCGTTAGLFAACSRQDNSTVRVSIRDTANNSTDPTLQVSFIILGYFI